MKFYLCGKCKKLIMRDDDHEHKMRCCGEEMEEVTPKTADQGLEKHVPFVKVEGDTVHVQIGEVIHPMTDVHHIEWILLETEHGFQKKYCRDTPVATFKLVDDKPVAVYEHCNIHGLWLKKL